jgi:hypothetical protein
MIEEIGDYMYINDGETTNGMSLDIYKGIPADRGMAFIIGHMGMMIKFDGVKYE